MTTLIINNSKENLKHRNLIHIGFSKRLHHSSWDKLQPNFHLA
ncbi:hypothetical protein [Yeosuana aromativorans]|nr:hypothetical protein [Yeosuana aromativorans]